MKEKAKYEWMFSYTGKFTWFRKHRTMHSFTDVDEVNWHFAFLWWNLLISKYGKGVIRKYYNELNRNQ